MKSLPNIQEDNRIAAEKAQTKKKQKRATDDLKEIDKFLRNYEYVDGGIVLSAGGRGAYFADDDLEAEIIKALKLKRVRLLHEANGAR